MSLTHEKRQAMFEMLSIKANSLGLRPGEIIEFLGQALITETQESGHDGVAIRVDGIGLCEVRLGRNYIPPVLNLGLTLDKVYQGKREGSPGWTPDDTLSIRYVTQE